MEETKIKKCVADGVEFDAEYKEMCNANIIGVTVGTTGYKGGDSGWGGRTLFRIKDLSSTDMNVSVDGGVVKLAESVELTFGGDAELDTFMDALSFGVRTLRKQSGNKPFTDYEALEVLKLLIENYGSSKSLGNVLQNLTQKIRYDQERQY